MSEDKETTGDTKRTEAETPHKNVATAVILIAGCAAGTFYLGAVCGAPWPAAVASCGLSVMGVGVAYVMMRRA
ncbi:MAG: hypothetical protein ABR955_12590 [Verrucomicrobiota bacterium]|jgi:hypothetical protein